MPNKEACEPCARRKVRCDKQEPSCSNCRRRKADRCVYPPISPSDRIRRLEALVRKLGGDPSHKASSTDREHSLPSVPQPQVGQAAHPPLEIRSGDPIVVEEDGQSFYLESQAWQDWLGNSNKNPFMVRKRPDAFLGLLSGLHAIDLSIRHPPPQQASILWSIFHQRIEPLVRITYRWTLEELRTKSMDTETIKHLSGPEHAFVLTIYLVSIVSLSDEECQTLLQQPRASLVAQYQTLCEDTLLRTNLFCMTDIMVIKALIFYMMASYDRLNTQSLWSLMGLTIRNAERIGLHRDGLAVGLSPQKTEDRRRVWWQLQHIDLCLAIWAGSTPMTLMADWDAKIPTNIEDDDIRYATTDMPEERRGLTSISYCRYNFWVLDNQRRIFRAKQGRFALSWQSNAGLAPALKNDVAAELEDGLNKNFVQFCDPLKPLDNLLQLAARYLVVGMRMRILHASVFHAGDKQQVSEEQRAALLEASVQNLKYNIAILSQEPLKRFQWYTKVMFSWHAFMFVLVEASRETDIFKAQETWELLASVYATNPNLFELSADRRRHHAAELVVAAWKAWQTRLGSSAQSMTPPDFVLQLEAELAAYRAEIEYEKTSASTQQQNAQSNVEPITPDSIMNEDMNVVFDLDFQDIDWSFWSSME